MLEIIKDIKERGGHPLAALCHAAGLPRSTLGRWRRRSAVGLAPVGTPGPVKPGPVDWTRLDDELRGLTHRRKRTLGSGDLRRRWNGVIARRPLQRLVEKARRAAAMENAAAATRVDWRVPGSVWATDTTEYRLGGEKVWLQTVRDLGSRYTFAPLSNTNPDGGMIASWLDEIMRRFPPPMFLRCDNATNQNCPAVAAVLKKHRVIPFNCPPAYPKYNGGIEKAQWELQQSLASNAAGAASIPREHQRAYAALAAHYVNHLPRRVLGGKTACHAFCSQASHAILTAGAREEVTEELITMAGAILNDTEAQEKKPAMVWRIAVKEWLVEHDFIRLKQKVSPIYQAQNGPLSR